MLIMTSMWKWFYLFILFMFGKIKRKTVDKVVSKSRFVKKKKEDNYTVWIIGRG